MSSKIIDRVTKLAFLSPLLLSVSIALCNAQITEAEAKKLAQADECLRMQSPDGPEFLRFTRLEDYEDFLFELRDESVRRPEKAAYIFRASSTGTFITDKNEIISRSSTNGKDERIVAVTKLGKVFALFGCENKETYFANLIRSVRIKMAGPDDALTFGYLYYSLLEDPDRQRLVYNLRDIKHLAENSFFGNYPEAKAEAGFKSWMRRISKVKLPSDMGIVPTVEGGKYSVKIFYMKLRRREAPQLTMAELILDPNGGYTRQPNLIF